MDSCIYEGRVRHSRTRPASHRFSYRLFMMYLDLDELPGLFEKRWFWSASRPALARFQRDDHLGPTDRPLADVVRDLVEKDVGKRPNGPIRLLTNLSYFGYCFNPVSFYYCFAVDGETVEFIVAEVNNTPWGERDTYVLDCRNNKNHAIILALSSLEENACIAIYANGGRVRLGIVDACRSALRLHGKFEEWQALLRCGHDHESQAHRWVVIGRRVAAIPADDIENRSCDLLGSVAPVVEALSAVYTSRQGNGDSYPMNTRTISIDSPNHSSEAGKLTMIDKLGRRIVLSCLENLRLGQIVVVENDGYTSYGRPTEDLPVPVQLRVLSPRFYSDIAFGGAVGAGESYIQVTGPATNWVICFES